MGTSQSPELTPGTTLTKHADFHEIQLVFRHSNNRYKQEMPSDHHLHQFSLDGTGLKKSCSSLDNHPSLAIDFITSRISMLIELVTPAGLTREKVVAELHSRGLLDVDIPRSTGLLHREPLYNRPYFLISITSRTSR